MGGSGELTKSHWLDVTIQSLGSRRGPKVLLRLAERPSESLRRGTPKVQNWLALRRV